jgi:membrane-associated protein
VTLSDQLLTALATYGLPVLFGVILAGSAGIPLPGSILLIAAGSFVRLGELSLWPVLGLAALGAILGDQVGYWIGRRGGRHLALKVTERLGAQNRLHDAEALAARWGGFGIFLSRWLLTPLGSWLNLTSGIAAFPYLSFLAWDIAGELIWAVGYMALGEVLSDRVQDLVNFIGNLTWVLMGLAGTAVFGGYLVRNLRRRRAT